jgi:protein MpaA
VQGPTELLVVAGIHGEEPETTVALSAALRSLRAEDLRSAVVLGANPDGLARGTRGNARGVELNRNFPTSDWSAAAPAHHFTRDEPQDVLLSPGSGPASEPETTALMALVGDLRPAAVLAFHAPLGCVLDPDEGDLARRLAAATGLPLRRRVPSPTPGTLDTWVRESAGVPAVTLELPVISKDVAIVRFLDVLAALLTEPRAVGGPAR